MQSYDYDLDYPERRALRWVLETKHFLFLVGWAQDTTDIKDLGTLTWGGNGSIAVRWAQIQLFCVTVIFFSLSHIHIYMFPSEIFLFMISDSQMVRECPLGVDIWKKPAHFSAQPEDFDSPFTKIKKRKSQIFF